MFIVSFLVDGLPAHYYKAEILLFSLEKFGKYTKESILVQCTKKVDTSFIEFLDENHYNYTIVEPYLDKKFCNKIAQLDALQHTACDGVFLLDVDLFILEPLTVPDATKFSAKLVDLPNPPIHVLESIFKASGLTLPKIVDSDVVTTHSQTYDVNFNGGFYYIPKQHLVAIRTAWRTWAEWLFERQDFFETPLQRNHIDQVSMGLALTELELEVTPLTCHSNLPMHLATLPTSFNKENVISVLHYHKSIERFGVIHAEYELDEQVSRAIHKANAAIVEYCSCQFYLPQKLAAASYLENISVDQRLLDEFKKMLAGKKLRLLLHGGSSKTGTTSLQFAFSKEKKSLLKKGVYYPDTYAGHATKHQWLVGVLKDGKQELLLNQFQKIIHAMDDDVHTIVLSTEGVWNHWWDFPDEGKAVIKLFSQVFDLQLVFWFREPVDLGVKLYRQNTTNPCSQEVNCYGQDLSYMEMLNDPWFVYHFDYAGICAECSALIGPDNVISFNYAGDTIAAFYKILNINYEPIKSEKRKNVGLSKEAIEIHRIKNRYPLDHKDSKQVLSLVYEIDAILEKYKKPGSDSSYVQENAFLRNLTALSWKAYTGGKIFSTSDQEKPAFTEKCLPKQRKQSFINPIRKLAKIILGRR
jgi:hypothetical protein